MCITKKKSKEEIPLKKEKSFKINKKIYPEYPGINQIPNNNINYNNNIFQENKNIKEQEINKINIPKVERKPESKKKKQNSDKNKPPTTRDEREIAKMEELCDELLDNNNKNNIIQIILNLLQYLIL